MIKDILYVMKSFLKIPKQNISVRISFSILLLVSGLCDFTKRVTSTEVFHYEFCKIFKNNFFTERHWATASRSNSLSIAL